MLKIKLSSGLYCAFLVAVVVGYPVVAAVSELLDINNRLASVPYRVIVLLLSLAILCTMVHVRFRLTLFWGAWWLFWGMYLFRIFLDSVLVPDSFPVPVYEYWMQSVFVCLIPAVAMAAKVDNISERALLSGIAAVGVLGLLLTGVVLIAKEQVSFGELFSGRLETPTLNPIALGHVAVTVMLISLCGFRIGSLPSKFTYGICFLIGVAGLIGSGSRGPILSLIVVVIAWAISKSKNFLVMMAAVIFSAPLFFLLIVDSNSYIVQRVVNGFFDDSGRAEIYRQSLDVLLSNFFDGGGVGPLGTYPHNLIVESFMALGVVGGAAFLAMFVSGWFSALKVMASGRHVWVAVLYVQYATFVMVSSSLYIANVFWMALACVITVSHSYKAGLVRINVAHKDEELI
ncbi:O-antigen ligase family protein [Pseudomonas sp. WS 5106]|uniref:O-antigen ligase family protein n=1 Tax=Pseudomonas cremoris TaxID=2724178 RepID=A0A7X1AL22_9PSED|nr:O-antigen ligase family protein [Pseudomonas cremoris]MBC2382864.1 O-antigen ligase family protein [Pseudomonas cremoris]MBC2406295.1 O-antigen ligase family protein [Pseudomonas cremoris]MBC2406931.1 O-antigen ligase family protein [Pseudomonas cremoris]